MRSKNYHYNYRGRSGGNRTQGSAGHSNWDWDRKHNPNEDHTRGSSRGVSYRSGNHDGYEQRGRNRSSYYGNDDYDYEYDNDNYGNRYRSDDNYGSRNRSNSDYGRNRNHDRRDSNYGSQYAGGFGGSGQQFSPEYGSYSNQRMNRSTNYGDDSRYERYSRDDSRRRYDDDDDNFFERAGRKIRNAWNDMRDDDEDNYHGYGTNQRVYGNSRYRSGRNDGRNFFQRAGERIRETWDDLTDRDDRRYREEEDDRRYGSRKNQHRSYNLFSRHDDRDFFDRSGPSLRDNRNDWDDYENDRNYRSGRYQRGNNSWFNENGNRYRTNQRERENMKRGLQKSEVW